jgi:hypothetical protein
MKPTPSDDSEEPAMRREPKIESAASGIRQEREETARRKELLLK